MTAREQQLQEAFDRIAVLVLEDGPARSVLDLQRRITWLKCVIAIEAVEPAPS